MREYLKFFIDGQWVEPAELETLDVENPATELVVGKIALGSAADVDRGGECGQGGLRSVVSDGWMSSTGS